jgi:hypothetical protein
MIKELSDRKLDQPELLDLHELPSLCFISNAMKQYGNESSVVGRIRTLSIAANNIKFIGARLIAGRIQRFNALTGFDVSGNPELGTQGVVCLLEALPISIESLSLRDTGLDYSEELRERLIQFTALSNLDVSNNSKVSHVGAYILCCKSCLRH